MPQAATYPVPTKPHSATAIPEKEGLSTKQWIGIGVGAAIVVGLGIRFAVQAVKQKRSDKAETKSFTEGSPETTAKRINMAFDNDGWPGTNTKDLRDIVTRVKSLQEWDQIVAAYKNLYDKDLNRRIESELQSSEFKEFLAIKGAKPAKTGQKPSGEAVYRSWAIRLKAAFDKTYGPFPGTDEEAVNAVFAEIPTQRAFINVGKAYNREFRGSDFIKDLKGDVDYDHYMKIILRKPNA